MHMKILHPLDPLPTNRTFNILIAQSATTALMPAALQLYQGTGAIISVSCPW
jgi:hypothetical protein